MIPVDSVRARVRGCACWMRQAEANPLVVALDHLVAGLAGGDQITAAVFEVDDQYDVWKRISCNGRVLEDRELTRNA